MPVIGFVDPRTPDALAERLRGFRQGLKDTGYAEGENVAIEYRWAENRLDRLPELVADLVRRQVSVIAAPGGFAVASVAKAATSTIPIIFIASDDPVRLGLVASLARPGGNLTGVNFLATELVAKRLELLRELVPGVTRMAVLVNPADAANTEPTLRDVEVAARGMGLQIQIVRASTSREIEAAFEAIARERPEAFFVGNAPFLNARRQSALAAVTCAGKSLICMCSSVAGVRTLVKKISGEEEDESSSAGGPRRSSAIGSRAGRAGVARFSSNNFELSEVIFARKLR
jgi:putative ABC transport system substrate-binding protein